jgi:hypothetical protein
MFCDPKCQVAATPAGVVRIFSARIRVIRVFFLFLHFSVINLSVPNSLS